MVETAESHGRSAQGWTNFVIGLLVFVLGIVLMLAAFYWGYNMLRGVDDQIRAVQTVSATPNPAAPALKPGEKPPSVVQATPAALGGPTLLQVAGAYVVKLIILLVLAAIGAMTASRGAQLAGMRIG
jgi:hypothetical protein